MPVTFDDLIPQGTRGSVSFDDLIPQPSGWLDFAKSIPRGVVSGLTGAMALSGQAEAPLSMPPEMAAGVPDPQQAMELTEQYITGQMHKPETTAGRYGASIGEMLGNPASYIGAGGVPAKIGLAALGGAGAEAGGELTGQSTLGRIAGGMVGAMSPWALTHLGSPAGAIPAGRAADAAALRARGVEPTAGDVTGSRWIRGAEKMGDLPGGGGSYSRNQETVAKQYTRELNRRMGIDEELATPEVFQRADSELSGKFEKATSGLVIKYDKKLADGLLEIVQEAIDDGLPKESIDRIVAQVKFINSGFITSDKAAAVMPGKNYHAVTRDGTPLARATVDRDPNVAYYTTRLRSELDDAASRAAHGRGTRAGTGRRQAWEDLEEARQQWYTMQVLRKSVVDSEQAGVEGLISPQKLRRNLTASPDAKTAYAVSKLREMGADDLFELSRAGNEVLSPIRARPDTSAGYTVAGLTSGLMGRVVNTGKGQSFFQNQVAVPAREFLPPPGWTAARIAVGAAEPYDQNMLPEGWSAQQVR